jgi:OmpA-OmpF porin, OOP family
MKIKAGGKAVIIALVVGGSGLVLNWGMKNGYFSQKAVVESSVPPRVDVGGTSGMNTVEVSTVNVTPVNTNYTAKLLTIPWNATMGLHFANGDVTTTPDSLLGQKGVHLKLERQDDYAQMLTEQIAFAQEVANGTANPKKGAAFVIIMGDGYPAYVYGAQDALSKIGQQIEVIGAVGYSRGEDKCIIDAGTNAKGSLIAAVLRDGDWNICVKWASDNGIAINPNEKTYDPNAMNFVAVNAFTEADEKFITGACEDRQVVGSRETKRVCVNGTATWTPGDVKVAQKKGNIRVLASTKEYMWQMPAIIIGNKMWNSKNPQFVENLLAGAFEGGERVRANDAALSQASGVVARVFKEETPSYWKKYYKGTTENGISLGGSSSIGLGDNAYLFGLKGNFNLYKSVYSVFGSYATKYYPDVLPKVVSYEQVVNTTYLDNLLNKSTIVARADTPVYDKNTITSGTFAKRSYSVEFEFNKATFTPQAVNVLEDMLNQLSISGLVVQVNGHTDGIGSPDANLTLSKQRANAVKSWIVANASNSFPEDRLKSRGYGDTSPIADNKTEAGRAKNRRVEIQLLK